MPKLGLHVYQTMLADSVLVVVVVQLLLVVEGEEAAVAEDELGRSLVVEHD